MGGNSTSSVTAHDAEYPIDQTTRELTIKMLSNDFKGAFWEVEEAYILFQNHYPRFTGAPFHHFRRPLTPHHFGGFGLSLGMWFRRFPSNFSLRTTLALESLSRGRLPHTLCCNT